MVSEVVDRSQRRADAGRTAWGIVLIFFAIFCVLCVFTGIGVNYFLFQSSVSMETLVRVGRGTITWTDATLIPQAERRLVELLNSAVISTDPQAQATMFITDQYQDQRLIATVTLKSDTTVDLESVTRPRFDWSSQMYMIELDQVQGELDVYIPEGLAREVWFGVRSTQGAIVRLIQHGQYTIRASNNQIQVTNVDGEMLVGLVDDANHRIAAGHRATLQIETGEITIQPGRLNLLGQDTFTRDNLLQVSANAHPAELVWGCNNIQNDNPSGFFDIVTVDGLSALRMGRGGGANSHGETLCSQYFSGISGQEGLDVSNLDYLGIRVTFKIVGHSLNACGTEGSECPLMLRMDYVPTSFDFSAQGSQIPSWIHGFYTRSNPDLDYPVRCISCTLDHDIVYEDAWYTYESGNLLQLIPQTPLNQQDQRPRSILNFRFYASGHEYDVYVSEMELLSSPMNGG